MTSLFPGNPPPGLRQAGDSWNGRDGWVRRRSCALGSAEAGRRCQAGL